MGMSRAALPPVSRSVRRSLALAGAMLATAAAGAAPALADAGKVLVFTGTAGTPNPVSADAATAIKALGTANNFTVDEAAAATDINPANLANYRAVVFLNTGQASPLTDAQRAVYETYFKKGGGFVGVGSAIETDPNWSFLTGVLGTR